MNIIYKNAVFNIKTLHSSVKEKVADLEIYESENTSLRSIIQARIGSKDIKTVIYWSHFSDDADVSIHWSEAENVLFVGGGGVSAAIDLKNNEIIGINYPVLFWNWECINEYVLELGELECRLYLQNGNLVGKTAVDPPYDYEVTKDAIEFSSIVVGKTSIQFNQSYRDRE